MYWKRILIPLVSGDAEKLLAAIEYYEFLYVWDWMGRGGDFLLSRAKEDGET